MSKLFWVATGSTGGEGSRDLERSLIVGLPVVALEEFGLELPAGREQHVHDGRVRFWGTRPSSANLGKWERLEPGDVALVYVGDGRFGYWGEVWGKARSRAVAEHVWLPSAEPWECLIFLDPLEKVDIRTSDLNRALEFGEATPRGFEILGDRAQAIVRRSGGPAAFIRKLSGDDLVQPDLEASADGKPSAQDRPFDTIPALRIGYAHRLLLELSSRGSTSIAELFAAVDPESMFKAEREHRAPVDRAQDLLVFARRLGLVDQTGERFSLTDIGEEYATAGDDEDIWLVSPRQAAILRDQLLALYESEGVLAATGLMLSILATAEHDRTYSNEELGRAIGRAADRTGWRSQQTFISQGSRFMMLLDDMELVTDGRVNALGQGVLRELDLPEHLSIEELLRTPASANDLRVWWVNQGSTYAVSRDGGFLWAPMRDKAGRAQPSWERVDEARPGDLVLHYSAGSIRAVGRVGASAVSAPRPESFGEFEPWQEEGRLVRVQYEELAEPIALTAIPEPWRAPTAGPFTAVGGVQQGYFYRLSDEFVADLAGRFPQLHLRGRNGVSLPPQPSYEEPAFEAIVTAIRSRGLRMDDQTLRRYHLSLKTRGFVILSGWSGSGKTWLAELYAEAVEAERLLVPVAPNWTTNEDLLGYVDPISGDYRDTPFSRFLLEASNEYAAARESQARPRPFHLILDEMNLARVEYYFARFLSAMEVRSRRGTASLELTATREVLLTPNLVFVGTVNVDETTHAFADKVYDRAQLVEVTVSESAVRDHLAGLPYQELVLDVWRAMRPVAPFAYRVLDEIRAYHELAEGFGTTWQEAVDEQLLQKVLPKVRGTDLRIRAALEQFLALTQAAFPLSHDKASAMLRDFDAHGFAAYFQA